MLSTCPKSRHVVRATVFILCWRAYTTRGTELKARMHSTRASLSNCLEAHSRKAPLTKLEAKPPLHEDFKGC